MVRVKQLEDDDSFVKYVMPKQLKFHEEISGVKLPLYCLGIRPQPDRGAPGELSFFSEEGEESLLDTLLLSQWEDRLMQGIFCYDVTASEIKAIEGRKKFIAQLNEEWNVDHLTMSEELQSFHQADVLDLSSAKHHEKLLFCVASSEKSIPELIASSAVPDNGLLISINASPIEYGHVLVVPYRSNSLYQFMDASCLEMVVEVSVGINNCSFRLFYDSSPDVPHLYFQACYFSNPLAVELMPVDTIYGNEQSEMRISIVAEYPIKTILFESNNDNFKRKIEVLVKICSLLHEKSISYNLLISDSGKKIFLFLQKQKLKKSSFLSAWECGGYFLFKSRPEFDVATEKTMLKRLSTVSIDDEGFSTVKLLCCSVTKKCGI